MWYPNLLLGYSSGGGDEKAKDIVTLELEQESLVINKYVFNCSFYLLSYYHNMIKYVLSHYFMLTGQLSLLLVLQIKLFLYQVNKVSQSCFSLLQESWQHLFLLRI
jgi:hypothetical protein